jgi:hypothetical protein
MLKNKENVIEFSRPCTALITFEEEEGAILALREKGEILIIG